MPCEAHVSQVKASLVLRVLPALDLCIPLPRAFLHNILPELADRQEVDMRSGCVVRVWVQGLVRWAGGRHANLPRLKTVQ